MGIWMRRVLVCVITTLALTVGIRLIPVPAFTTGGITHLHRTWRAHVFHPTYNWLVAHASVRTAEVVDLATSGLWGLAAGLVVAFLSVKRSRGLLCRKCGYDLRGSKPAGECPECGAKYDTRA